MTNSSVKEIVEYFIIPLRIRSSTFATAYVDSRFDLVKTFPRKTCNAWGNEYIDRENIGMEALRRLRAPLAPNDPLVSLQPSISPTCCPGRAGFSGRARLYDHLPLYTFILLD
jgi:hypothetical protein